MIRILFNLSGISRVAKVDSSSNGQNLGLIEKVQHLFYGWMYAVLEVRANRFVIFGQSPIGEATNIGMCFAIY